MEAKGKRLKYSGITLGTFLVMAFVLVQPTMNQANAVGLEGLPGYDNCQLLVVNNQPEDPISMNTVRSGNIVKTIHAEKEIFSCFLDQGNLPVIVDVTTYIEIYENIDDREVIETNAVATTCLKDQFTAAVIDCESYDIPTSPVFVGNSCEEIGNEFITHPQEMNTVTKGKLAKTVEAQKEVFLCQLNNDTFKKVDIVLFTEIYEDLNTQTTTSVQFLSARCVVLWSDDFESDPEDTLRDATVETCQFSSIEN
ncbi:MAG: hypothetical protein HMLIMOIP_000556 [Candidatus Nitrosomirales archaeon]|jgi:hypothetical protein